MNKNQEILLKLIKQSQFKTSSDVNFADVNLEELYNEASIQSLLGLIAKEIPDEYLNKQWEEERYFQIASYIAYIYGEEELVKILDKENIRFVILKGNAAAINYKDPSCRTMGDVDFIVLEDDLEKTKNVLLNNGYTMTYHENKDPRHISYTKNGIEFELHKKFSHVDVDIDDVIKEGFENIERYKIKDHEFPMLPRLSNGIVLLEHMKNHLKKGLGLRQMIDWMMYVYRNLDDEFWNKEFGIVAKEKGMDALAITATRMCQIYLGLPETITWCKDADEKLCGQLINCLLESGNFGRKNNQGKFVELAVLNIKNEGLFKRLQSVGEKNWEAYHKHHWLKPFCWLYQGFRYAKFGFKAKRNNKQLKDDLKRSKERYELLKKLNITIQTQDY